MFGPTGLYAQKMSFTPALASISASAMVAHLCFAISRSSCSRVTSRILCVLQCGRNRAADPAIFTIRSRFCSTRSRKITTAGETMELVSAMA
jgi:hypothetical protein